MDRRLQLADDRREDRRIHAELEVTVRITELPPCKVPPPRKLQGMTTDVSSGGSRVVLMTHVLVPVDTQARLRLRAGRRVFKLNGTVRWEERESHIAAYVVGFDVSGSSRSALRAWRKYVAKQLAPKRADSRPVRDLWSD